MAMSLSKAFVPEKTAVADRVQTVAVHNSRYNNSHMDILAVHNNTFAFPPFS